MLNAAMMIFAPSQWRLNLSIFFKTLQQKTLPSGEQPLLVLINYNYIVYVSYSVVSRNRQQKIHWFGSSFTSYLFITGCGEPFGYCWQFLCLRWWHSCTTQVYLRYLRYILFLFFSLTYMLTRASNFTTYTEEDGTTINNEDRKQF